MRSKKIIGIDLMGNDNSPKDLLDALHLFAPSLPSHIQMAAIGTPDCAPFSSSFKFYPASEAIGMEEHPLSALRKKKNSSISIGLRLLKQGAIDAFVSAGNTGALVSSAKMILGTFAKLLRPALLALMPTKKGPIAVLDVGANLKEDASLLIQFAYLGSAYQSARGIKRPRTALLNIGSEALKGTSEIRTAYQKLTNLKHAPFDFVGNIEGKSVFEGDIDVLVADGFTGNIFLKTSEGIASFILDQIGAHFSQENLDPLRYLLHHSGYPGALLAGVKGTVVKCHSYATSEGILRGIKGAVEFISSDFVTHLEGAYK